MSGSGASHKYQCLLCKRTNFLHAKAFWGHTRHNHEMTKIKFPESFGKTDFVQHHSEIVCVLCRQSVLHDYIILQRHVNECHENNSLKEYFLYIAAEEDGPTLYIEDDNKAGQDKEDQDKEDHNVEDYDVGDHDVEGPNIQDHIENDKEARQGHDKACGDDSCEDTIEDLAILPAFGSCDDGASACGR